LGQAEHFVCVVCGAGVVAADAVAVHRVEVPLGRVDDEVVLWPGGVLVAAQQAKASVQFAPNLGAVAHTPMSPSGLGGELHGNGGVGCSVDAGVGVVENRSQAALGEREPRTHLE
jgi:hypothetical protein